MTKLKVKKGDTAVVIVGKDKGKSAEVSEVFPKENRLTLKGLNIIVKHNKPKSAQDKGGIVKKEGKLQVSSVMVVCPACRKATRVKMGVSAKGEKIRLCKKCGAPLDSGVKKVSEKKTPAKVVKTDVASKTASTDKTKATTQKAAVKPATNMAKNHQPKTTVKTSKPETVKKTSSTVKKIGSK